MRNPDAVDMGEVIADLSRTFQKGMPVGVLHRGVRWKIRRFLRQYQLGTTLVFFAQEENKFRTRAGKIHRVNGNVPLELRIDFQQPGAARRILDNNS